MSNIYLKRKIDEKLLLWLQNRKQALLIDGARQIGKTSSIENFIHNNFSSYIELNFAEHPDQIPLFAKLQNYKDFELALSLFGGEKMVPYKTVVFLDEIQLVYKYRKQLKDKGADTASTIDPLTAIKPLVQEGKYRYIFSGSLLGIELNDIVLDPVGYLDTYQMFPLDFEEFLIARGVGEAAVNYIKDSFKKLAPLKDEYHKLFLRYINEYVLIGGMPEAVSEFLNSNNFYNIDTVQQQIIHRYKTDITSYISDYSSKLNLREIYDAIPSEINSKNKRFIMSRLTTRNKERILNSFIWLDTSGVAIPVYNVTVPELPLSISSKRQTLKLFYNDTGLLSSALMTPESRKELLLGNIKMNYGAPYENFAACELTAHGCKDHLYYYNSKKHGEVDFLIEYQNNVLPIEIKSGKPNQLNVYNHVALNNLMELYPSIPSAFVFGEGNIIKEKDRVISLPLYFLPFLENSRE